MQQIVEKEANVSVQLNGTEKGAFGIKKDFKSKIWTILFYDKNLYIVTILIKIFNHFNQAVE